MSVDILEVDDVLKEYVSKDNLSTEDNVEGNEYIKKRTQKVDIFLPQMGFTVKGIRYK